MSRDSLTVLLAIALAASTTSMGIRAAETDGTAAPVVVSPTPTGFYPHAHLPRTQPRVVWKFRSDSGDPAATRTPSLSNTTSADGVVYAGDERGGLFAILAENGKPLWKAELKTRLGTPSVDSERVYVTSEAGVLAIDRERGEIQWRFPIGNGAGESTPISIGGALFVSGYDGHAYGIEAATGLEVWKHDFGADGQQLQGEFENQKARFQEIRARPRGSSSDGDIFLQAVFDQSRLVAIDCGTGQRRWSFQAAGWTADGPTISDGRVFIGSQDQHVYCLDRQTGQPLWKFQAPTWLASRPAVHDGRLYVPAHRGRLYQLDARTGDVLWAFQPAEEAERNGHIYSFPIVTEDTVYFAAGSGWVYAVDTSNGELRWKLQPSPGSELYSDLSTDGSRLFVTSRNREKEGENAVIAIGLSTEPASL
jgi:outer membrane protein assembly factor BamB